MQHEFEKEGRERRELQPSSPRERERERKMPSEKKRKLEKKNEVTSPN